MKQDEVGKQKSGRSSDPIYRMALRALDVSEMKKNLSVLDVGGGRGEFTRRIRRGEDENILIDANPPSELKGVRTKECDLNCRWPIDDKEIDVLFALEVIEHVENTRFFMREVERVLQDAGVAFLSTPNNESFFSRLTFLLKGEHRYFRESHYPAHINPVLTTQIERVCKEVGLTLRSTYWSGVELVPKLGVKMYGGGKLFSKNAGFLISKK